MQRESGSGWSQNGTNVKSVITLLGLILEYWEQPQGSHSKRAILSRPIQVYTGDPALSVLVERGHEEQAQGVTYRVQHCRCSPGSEVDNDPQPATQGDDE